MKPFYVVRFTGDNDEKTRQWLQSRKKGIGGSDAAAVLGLNHYKSPYNVWLEKTYRVDPDDISDNPKVYWGTVLESVVADEFARRHPEMNVRRLNGIMVSYEYPFMIASIDREINDGGNKGILEIKTAGESAKHDWEDGIPDYYLPQVNHYLAVSGYEFAYVAVLIGGNDYREYRIERDDDDIAYMIEREAAFWEHVKNDTQPPMIGIKAESDALVEQYSSSDDVFIEMLDQDVPEIGEREEIKKQIKELEKRESEITNNLKAMIGEHYGIKTPRYKITWSRSETSRFDSKRFKKDHPEMVDEYTVTATRDNGLRASVIK